MADYEFKIGAYNPKTIPMARLAEYMAALADLIGEKDRVHFEKLKAGSTILAIRVQPEARVRSRRRIQEARSAEKDHPTYKPFHRINSMLRDDGAEGKIYSGSADIIKFPGVKQPLPQVVGPFNKHTELDGVLVRIGGKDKIAHALIEDADGVIWSCEVDRDMARRLAPYLFGQPLRLTGEGRWLRNIEARWELVKFRPSEFTPLKRETLGDSIAAIRKLGIKANFALQG